MKKLLSIEIQGKHNRFFLHFYGDPAYIPSWQAEGFDVQVVDEVIPFNVEGLMLADKSLAH